VIVERDTKSDLPDITKRKFLVPSEITIGLFSYEIRKHLPSLDESKSLFLFIDNALPPAGQLMSQLYEQHQDQDGFLYIVYSGIGAFGGN